jgi:hypothetical protein
MDGDLFGCSEGVVLIESVVARLKRTSVRLRRIT